MTHPSVVQLTRHHERVKAMLADYECVGELLLIGLVMARAVDLDDPPVKEDGTLRMGIVADLVYGNGWYPTHLAYPRQERVDSRPRARLLDVLRADIRRYEPPDNYHQVTCGKPMPERETGRCGRNPHHKHIARLTDPATGERQYVAACSYPAHRAWWTALREENARQLAEHRSPRPPANVGGVLARHLPEVDWEGLYVVLDTRWTPPPEGRPFAAPRLTVVVDNDTADAGDVDQEVQRPALRVIEGGWR